MTYVMNIRNVNEAWVNGMRMIADRGIEEGTRNGPALVLDSPFVTEYARPRERCLFSPSRRANPFFHLFESMWMIAGRRDAAFLSQFVSDFGDRFAETDGNLHGAYGHRWRNHFGVDQVESTLSLLHMEVGTRRAVISMWDPDSDSNVDRRDIPCNTTLFFRERGHVLDMTVCCRSNDAIWGAWGANAVHFSVLQEYMAWRLSRKRRRPVLVGRMVQVSNNLHAYRSTMSLFDPTEGLCQDYHVGEVMASSLFEGCYPAVLDTELDVWMTDVSNASGCDYESPLLRSLLVPMGRTWRAWKDGHPEIALAEAENIGHADWRHAARLRIAPRAKS